MSFPSFASSKILLDDLGVKPPTSLQYGRESRRQRARFDGTSNLARNAGWCFRQVSPGLRAFLSGRIRSMPVGGAVPHLFQEGPLFC